MTQRVYTVVVAHTSQDPITHGERKYFMEHRFPDLNLLLEDGYQIHEVHQSTTDHYTVLTFIIQK